LSGKGPSRRLVVWAVGLAAAAGIAVGLLQGPSHSRSAPPPGGSRFEGATTAGGRESLIDALAPLLAADAGLRGSSARALNVSLARAVAQLFVVGIDGTEATRATIAPLHAHDWGGVVLGHANYRSAAQLAALARAIRATLSTPPLIIARQGGGDSNAFTGLAPDSEPALGAIGRTDLVNGQAQLAARQLRHMRVNTTLAPAADIGYGAGPAAGRAYGTDPARTARLARAAVDGYRTGGLIAVVGHFPGEGAASQDPAKGAATVGLSRAELEARDLQPFRAVARVAPVIELSNALYVAFDGVTPATLLPDAVAWLREKLHYQGLILSGNLQAVTAATGGSVAEAAVAALQAGCDLLYVPGSAADAESAYGAVLSAIRQGKLDATRVARSLARVIALKRAFRVA
jgi:beta-N-acetylhexosaminidase